MNPTGSTPPHPLVGPLMIVVGVTHVAITPLIQPGWVTSIREGGVVGAVERDPKEYPGRALGFWYVTSGLGMIGWGAAVVDRERQSAPLPRSLAGTLAGLGLTGVVLMPKSPFWVFLGLSGLTAWQRGRATRGGAAE